MIKQPLHIYEVVYCHPNSTCPDDKTAYVVTRDFRSIPSVVGPTAEIKSLRTVSVSGTVHPDPDLFEDY